MATTPTNCFPYVVYNFGARLEKKRRPYPVHRNVMENSIALPINCFDAIDSPPRVFKDGGRYGWREVPYWQFSPSALDYLRKLAKRDSFTSPDTKYWTTPLYFPDGWPPQRIADYLNRKYDQASLF